MSLLPPALITGAARRVGRAFALHLAERGHPVCVHYHHSQPEAEDLVEQLRARGKLASAHQADLSDAQALEQLLHDAAHAHSAPVGVLVHNASSFIYDDISSVTADTIQQNLATNLVAPILLSRYFAAQKELQQGVIVMMLDQKLWGLNPDYLSYTAAKAGLHTLMEMLAMQLAPRIRVAAIAPGLTLPSANMSEARFHQAQQATPLGRSSQVDDLVRALEFILQSPAYTGQTLVVDGGEHMLRRTRDVLFAGKGGL